MPLSRRQYLLYLGDVGLTAVSREANTSNCLYDLAFFVLGDDLVNLVVEENHPIYDSLKSIYSGPAFCSLELPTN